MDSGQERRSNTLEIRYSAKAGMVHGVGQNSPLLLCPIPYVDVGVWSCIYRSRVNVAVLELLEREELQKLQKKWWYDKGECVVESDKVTHQYFALISPPSPPVIIIIIIIIIVVVSSMNL